VPYFDMAVNVNKFGRYQCPCCGYYTFWQAPTGAYDICSVCYWEDDPLQGADPTYAGGANSVSLHQAQQFFRELGTSDPDCISVVRKPNREELPD
jgi:hypothetical protein